MNPASPPDRARTPLLLAPGTLCDAAVFAPLLAALPPTLLEGREVTLAPMTVGRTVGEAAAALLAQAPDRFALLGFSLGGIVALEVATQAPDRVRGLALVDSNAGAVDPADRPARRAAAALGAVDLERYVGEALWPTYVAPARRDDAALRQAIQAMAGRVGAAAFARQIDTALSRPDSRGRLAALTVPALVLAGTQDALCPPAAQRDMARALPDAELALIPDAGHFALLEQPAAVAAAVAGWLARVDARALVAAR